MNNRQIKFRAFHIGEEKMCNVELIRPGEGAFLSDLIPETDQINFDLRLIIKAPESGRFCDLSEFHLLQYTGLKDKNGVEIYEGDIVKFTDIINYPVAKIASIGFEDAAFTMDYKTEASDLLHLHYPLCEVIGDIYSNPELINNNLTK